MEDAIMDMQARGIKVVFTDVHGQPRDLLERLGLIPGLVKREICFENFAACATWLVGYLKQVNKVLPPEETTD